MGFFKSLGSLAGTVIGGVVGGAVELVGEATDSTFIKEIGQGVYKSSIRGCEMIGQAVDGGVSIADGILTSDKDKVNKGFNEVGDTVVQTVVGIGNGIGNVAKSGKDIIEGISEGDNQKISNGSRNLVKAVSVGALAVGVLDVLDIIGDDVEDVHVADADIDVDHADGFDTDGDGIADSHYVDPHYVHRYDRADGTHVDGYWRDGDGDTSVNLTEAQGGGYIRSNPNS